VSYDLVAAALQSLTRGLVINALRMQPRSVAEIHRVVNLPRISPRPLPELSRPAISQALRVLEKARLVKCRVVGRRHIYQLDQTGFDELRSYLEGLEDLPGFGT
jgi:DNA-binding transcriptional ArsR family regulator